MPVLSTAKLSPTAASIRGDLVTIGALALPIVALATLTVFTQAGSLVIEDARLHAALVGTSVVVSVLLGVLALRAHVARGDTLTLGLATGLLASAAVAVWGGVFNSGGPAFRHLVYAPVASAFFGLSLLALQLTESFPPQLRRRNVVVVGTSVAVMFVATGVLGGAASAFALAKPVLSEAARLGLWFGAAFVSAIAAIMLVVSDRDLGPTTSVLLPIGIGLFTEQAIFGILAVPWSVLWWASHVLGIAGVVTVAWTVLVVYQEGERLREIEKLREYDMMKTRLINSAAHELGTPLTPIKVQIHMLRAQVLGDLNERQQRSVDILDRNVSHLCALVQDVLDAARLQANRVMVKPELMDLQPVVAEAVEAFRAAAAQKGVALDHAAGERLSVEADPKRVTQVMFNLLSNAVKFTPSGGRIRVHVDAFDGHASVTVSDDGAGIAPKDLERLFQPFSQVHDGSEHTQLGTGLGLYITRGLVEQHGGRIVCASEGRGKGTAFTFTLPRVARVAVPVAVQRN